MGPEEYNFNENSNTLDTKNTLIASLQQDTKQSDSLLRDNHEIKVI